MKTARHPGVDGKEKKRTKTDKVCVPVSVKGRQRHSYLVHMATSDRLFITQRTAQFLSYYKSTVDRPEAGTLHNATIFLKLRANVRSSLLKVQE